jgi:hypothetical protein
MLDKKIWDLFDSTKSNGFVIISFEISESGNVEGIEFSKNLPLEIKNVITNSLLATNGSWQPANVNGLSIRKRILQPIVYQYKGNQNYDIDINEIEKAFDFEKKWRELENKKYMDAIILPLCLTGFSVTKSKP